MVCSSEGRDPNDTNHTPANTMSYMTFIRLTNNIQQGSILEEFTQKEWTLNDSDNFLLDHEEDTDCPDNITAKNKYTSSGDAYTPVVTTVTCNPCTFPLTNENESEVDGEYKDNGWKLEAVKGFLENEKEQMSGGSAWWKNITADISSDLTTAYIDWI